MVGRWERRTSGSDHWAEEEEGKSLVELRGGKRSPSSSSPAKEEQEEDWDYYYSSSEQDGGTASWRMAKIEEESPTIEKHLMEQRRQNRKRSQQVMQRWRRRQRQPLPEKAERTPSLKEEEDKNLRNHFVEYTEEEYEEMQESLVREGIMSPPAEGHLTKKHLSI